MIRWVAVIVSWVVDIGGTNVFGLFFYGWAFATGQLPMGIANDPLALTSALVARPDLYAISFVGGTSFSLLAGYVAARMAGRAFLLHGLLSSAACLASDVLSRDTLMQLPLWLVLSGIVISPAAGIAGAYFRQMQVGRRQSIPA